MFVDIKGIQLFKKEKICFVDKNSKSVFLFFLEQKQSKIVKKVLKSSYF